MRCVVQRVDGARVSIDGEVVGAVEGPGLCVLVGVTHDDTPDVATRMASKVWRMRLFDPERLGERFMQRCAGLGGSREMSAADLGLPVLVVSQFTLYGSTRKGRRPTWEAAAPASLAQPIVAAFSQGLRDCGAEVAEGRFGAMMRVELVNDGPVTLIVD